MVFGDCIVIFRQLLLVNAVETRLKLKGREQVAYEYLLQQQQVQEVKQMELTWAQEIEVKAENKGRQEGRIALVRHLLTARFGPSPIKSVGGWSLSPRRKPSMSWRRIC